MPPSFTVQAQTYWTPEREAKVTGGKHLWIKPTNAAQLLRSMSLLNRDGSMAANDVRKYRQINHMLSLLTHELDALCSQMPVVHILDIGCGNAYLTFAIAWYLREIKKKPFRLFGIDREAKYTDASSRRAQELGMQDQVTFIQGDVTLNSWSEIAATLPPAPDGEKTARPHLLVALHACDQATDLAMAIGIKSHSDVIAVAPCCQAELATHWAQSAKNLDHPMRPIFQSPHLRREIAAQMTDAMRLLLLRANGYESLATEFVDVEHTPKNRLIKGIRRGKYLESAKEEFTQLKRYVGDYPIALERFLLQELPAGAIT